MRRKVFQIEQKGNFKKAKNFLKDCKNIDQRRVLNVYGEIGTQMLTEATPKDTGKTALRWKYEVRKDKSGNTSLSFVNSKARPDAPDIVSLLVYGHATRAGNWIPGRDFVTPVADYIFDKIQKSVDKEVRNIGDK